MTSKYPRCHFCKQEIAEGHRMKTRINEKNVVVCFDCTDIIAAVAHDLAGTITDLSHIMSEPSETWKERLEMWQIEEDPTE